MPNSNENQEYQDGLKSLTNQLANNRNAAASNTVRSDNISNQELNEIYKTGLGGKIVRIKSSHVFKEGFNSEDKRTEDFVNKKLMPLLEKSVVWMLAFGRGIVLIDDGTELTDLSKPLSTPINTETVKFKSYDSYDITTATNLLNDITEDRYYKPVYYYIDGATVHYTRVIDLTYVEPTRQDKPNYQYGGISEYELIYQQIINDGIVERSGGAILERNATLFYKIKDFKENLRQKKEGAMLEYFTSLENLRSIYGAGIMDAEDETKVENQSLSNYDEVDTASLRRLAMVTSIPLSWLVGEAVQGLNASGKNEESIFWSMISTLGKTYILPAVNESLKRMGLAAVELNEQYQQSPLEKAEFESKVLDNAVKLQALGIDYEPYLKDKDIKIEDTDNNFGNIFTEEEE